MLRTELLADPHNLFLHDVVLDSCRRNAAKTALVDTSCARRIAYAEYGEIVESVARGLIAAGVKPGEVVAIFLTNSWEFCAAFHGSQLAGAIPALLNPTYREREVRYQLENSGAAALISDGACLEGINLGGLPNLRHVFYSHVRRSAPGTEPFASLLKSVNATVITPLNPGSAFQRGPRRSAVFKRHHRPPEGRDALAPESGRECLPIARSRCHAIQPARPHSLLPASLPHLRAERDSQPGTDSWRNTDPGAAVQCRLAPQTRHRRSDHGNAVGSSCLECHLPVGRSGTISERSQSLLGQVRSRATRA